MDEELYRIDYYPPIEGARKDLTPHDEEYDPDNIDHYSEWAYAIALREFEIGQEITEDEMREALELAKTQQVLDTLIEKGYIHMVWDEEQEEPTYYATEAGEAIVKDDITE